MMDDDQHFKLLNASTTTPDITPAEKVQRILAEHPFGALFEVDGLDDGHPHVIYTGPMALFDIAEQAVTRAFTIAGYDVQ